MMMIKSNKNRVLITWVKSGIFEKFASCFPLLLVVFLIASSVSAQTGKRGIAYGSHSPEDLEALSPEVSWWYNWAVTPESPVAEVFQNYDFEFVPMAWNGNYNEPQIRAFLAEHPETKYILAFNEPNFLEQANMTPSEAVAKWPRLEAIADEFNLEIVGPAVNFCGDCVTENGTTYYDPFDYLDDFFEACPDCRVDHIAVHCYMNTVSAFEWFIGEFKRYDKPIWVTEFAGWEDNGNVNNVQDQINFMMGAVNFLESEPAVFRYSWFIGRWHGINLYPHIDLLGAEGKLTPLGEVYKNMPVHHENRVVQIPAKIEAEEYNKMSGMQLELTTDTSGFGNMGYIEKEDWLEYKIDVPEAGSYDIDFRVASVQRARLFVYVNGELVLNQTFERTADWQNWETFSNTIELPGGVSTIRLEAGTANFNINWFQIGDVPTTVSSIKNREEMVRVYPNPGNGKLNVRATADVKKLQFVNLTGSLVHSQPFAKVVDVSFLQPGIYFLRAINNDNETVSAQKIVIR